MIAESTTYFNEWRGIVDAVVRGGRRFAVPFYDQRDGKLLFALVEEGEMVDLENKWLYPYPAVAHNSYVIFLSCEEAYEYGHYRPFAKKNVYMYNQKGEPFDSTLVNT